MSRSLAVATAILLVAWNSNAQAQVKLEYKFQEGTKVKSHTITKTHQILTINGADQETQSDQTLATSLVIEKRKPDGTLPLQHKIEAIQSHLTIQGKEYLNFDSANPPAKEADNPLGFVVDLLKALTGSTYTMSLDKSNACVSVEGIQQFFDQHPDLDPQAAEALKQRLTADHIKKEFEREHANLPTILVRPGDTWDHEEVLDIDGGQSLTFQKRYEYLGTVKKDGKMLHKLGVKASKVKYSMDPNANTKVKADDAVLNVESSEGTLLFDSELGRVVDSKSKYHVKGPMKLTVNGQELKAELDLTLELNTASSVSS